MNLPITKMMSLLKYKDLRTDQLTIDVIRDVAGVLDLPTDHIGAPIVEQVMALLRENNIDAVADIVSNSGVWPKLVTLMQPPTEELIKCPHCGEFILPQE